MAVRTPLGVRTPVGETRLRKTCPAEACKRYPKCRCSVWFFPPITVWPTHCSRKYQLKWREPVGRPGFPKKIQTGSTGFEFWERSFGKHELRQFSDLGQFRCRVRTRGLLFDPHLTGLEQQVRRERLIPGARRRGPDSLVNQDGVANGYALVTDIRPRIIARARNELRYFVLRFMAERAGRGLHSPAKQRSSDPNPAATLA